MFYEAWIALESNSSAATDELEQKPAIAIAESHKDADNEQNTIRQLRLTNLPDFPLTEFLGLSFTHHIRILAWRMYAA